MASSTAIFSHQPVTLDERRHWWQTRIAQGYPVLVARDAQGVAGFSTFGDFRPWPGYRFSVEHTVHVRAADRDDIAALLAHTALGAARAMDYMRVDKKVQAGRVRLILLDGLGKAVATGDYPDSALHDTLTAHFG